MGFGVLMPVVQGALGVMPGRPEGLSVGGCTVLGAMAASASYIAATPAGRVTLPRVNPTYFLTAALAVTFSFNILAGTPLYFQLARFLTREKPTARCGTPLLVRGEFHVRPSGFGEAAAWGLGGLLLEGNSIHVFHLRLNAPAPHGFRDRQPQLVVALSQRQV